MNLRGLMKPLGLLGLMLPLQQLYAQSFVLDRGMSFNERRTGWLP